MEQAYGSVGVSERSASPTSRDLHAPLLSPKHKQQQQQQQQQASNGTTAVGITPGSTESKDSMSLADKLYAYDLTLATLTYQRFGRSRAARIAGEVLCHTGDGYLWLLTFPPLLGLLWLIGMVPDVSDDTKTFIEALYVFFLVDIVGIMLLKLVFKRHRPPHHAADARFMGPDQHSFPSGHATRVWGVLALLVALAETRPAMLERVFHTSTGVVLAVAVVWVLLINFTRVALGRHYPSDVLAGSLIGFFAFYPLSALIAHAAGIL